MRKVWYGRATATEGKSGVHTLLSTDEGDLRRLGLAYSHAKTGDDMHGAKTLGVLNVSFRYNDIHWYYVHNVAF